ncbi:hypothetical protein Q7I33_17655 [Aeromonas allosaccharophila]|uniref:hypothetical protein n=1 Tax=Aeromonas allosaccharophila TaxID=656 RepID=UPI0030041853
MEKYGKMLLFIMAAPLWSIDCAATDEAVSADELAKKLANPVASLISVPVQYNYDELGGVNTGASVSRVLVIPPKNWGAHK